MLLFNFFKIYMGYYFNVFKLDIWFGNEKFFNWNRIIEKGWGEK